MIELFYNVINTGYIINTETLLYFTSKTRFVQERNPNISEILELQTFLINVQNKDDNFM